MNRLTTLALIAAFGVTACQKQQDQAQAQDSTARNLTLAPAESSATMRDVPDRQAKPPATPRTRTPAQRNSSTTRPNTPPAAPAQLVAGVGTKFDIAATDTISSRTAKVGDAFTARVMSDVKDVSGQVVIPAGSTVHGTVTAVKPAPNPRTPGTLTLSVSNVTVRGTSYPIEAAIDSVQTTTKGRGVTTGDAAKVGAGAVAGAVLGRVLGGNKKGTIIGGIAGGIAGAGVANATKDSDIILPAGAHIVIRLTKELAVSAQ
ncbi:MAG TPA: hypothetical protein VIV83_10025 [Gemmatimonadales bacterium]|jgi:hypothetical protein